MKHYFKLFFLIFFFTSCSKELFFGKNGGVVITFDDKYIDEWWLADSLLKKHNWKATFCVTRINKCTTSEIRKLHDLQNAGHEIAGHGLNHINSTEYISQKGIESYLNTEIIPMIESMRKKSFTINSFAHPYGEHSEVLDSTLLHYFKIIRATTYGIKDVPEYDFFFDNSAVVYGIGIDNSYEHFSEKYIIDLLSYAKNTGRILIIYAHKPVKSVTSSYQTTISTLDLICDYVKKNNMNYYTLSDLSKLL